GQMWKFDVSATATASWTGKRLFAAPLASGTTNPPGAGEYYPAQGIYGAPTLALDKDLKLWLFFGTGDRNHPNSTTAPNRFYGIKDTTNMTNGATLTEPDLDEVTGANATATSKPLSSAVVGTTNQEVLGNLIPAPAVMKQVRWWRELAQ